MGLIGRGLAVVMVVWVSSLASPAHAEAPGRQPALAGVSAVHVDVAPLSGGPESGGLSGGAVRGAVEARLATRRIGVVGQEERDARRLPTLYVRVVVLPARPAVVAYYVAIELWQVASVGEGAAAGVTYVPTWSSLGYLGVADGPQALTASLEEALFRELDQFLAAHAAANPAR